MVAKTGEMKVATGEVRMAMGIEVLCSPKKNSKELIVKL